MLTITSRIHMILVSVHCNHNTNLLELQLAFELLLLRGDCLLGLVETNQEVLPQFIRLWPHPNTVTWLVKRTTNSISMIFTYIIHRYNIFMLAYKTTAQLIARNVINQSSFDQSPITHPYTLKNQTTHHKNKQPKKK